MYSPNHALIVMIARIAIYMYITIIFASHLQDHKALQHMMKEGDATDDLSLTLVRRVDGIVNLEYIHLLAQSPEVADTFKKSVNALTANMLNAHGAPEMFLRKQ